jgi:hypothetical protein
MIATQARIPVDPECASYSPTGVRGATRGVID